MSHYITKRIFLLFITLLGLLTIVFFISRVAPSDPARLAAGPDANEEMVKVIERKFGLDKPQHIQYFNYLKGVFRGDFGQSIRTRHKVSKDLARFFPATLELVLFSLTYSIILGVLLGVLSAIYQNSWIDHFSRLFSISGLGLPQFWLALMLQLLIASNLNALPLGGRIDMFIAQPKPITHFYLIDSLITGNWLAFRSSFLHIILPSLALSFPALATIIRISRADMLDVMGEDYITTARSKGLAEKIVIWKHGVKNALISTVTMVGLRFGWTLGGTVLVETVFDWPGIGLYAVKSATFSDFEPIVGVTVLIGLCFTVANLIVDLLYGFLDPRISYD